MMEEIVYMNKVGFEPIRKIVKEFSKYNRKESADNGIPTACIAAFLIEELNVPVVEVISSTNVYLGEGDYGDLEYFEYGIMVKDDKGKRKYFDLRDARYCSFGGNITEIDDSTSIDYHQPYDIEEFVSIDDEGHEYEALMKYEDTYKPIMSRIVSGLTTNASLPQT
jgi:hypothetical protein